MRSYGMLVYQPPGLKPRRFLMYDAFPKDCGLTGVKGLPKVMAERHKKLTTSTDNRKVFDTSYADLSTLSDFLSTLTEDKQSLRCLMTDIVQSADSLAQIGMKNIYLIMWKVRRVNHRQTEVL